MNAQRNSFNISSESKWENPLKLIINMVAHVLLCAYLSLLFASKFCKRVCKMFVYSHRKDLDFCWKQFCFIRLMLRVEKVIFDIFSLLLFCVCRWKWPFSMYFSFNSFVLLSLSNPIELTYFFFFHLACVQLWVACLWVARRKKIKSK